MRTDLLDAAVYGEACALLEQPQRSEQGYRLRLAPPDDQVGDQTVLKQQRTKLHRGLERVIDSYAEGFLDKEEFESRIVRQRQRLPAVDERVRQPADAAQAENGCTS